MNVGSLFSGIGGLDLGLERAGMRVAWQCELDPWCRGILARHWPGVPCYEDVRSIGADAPRVDVLAGGFPCQPVSEAGLRLGQADERWLWPEFSRLVRELRPRFVIVENVPGLLAPIRERGSRRIVGPAPVGEVLGDLAALGFDAEWTVFGARDVGAPHKRDRVWIVAWDTDADGHRRQGLAQPDCRTGGGLRGPLGHDADRLRMALADADGARREGRQRSELPARGRDELARSGEAMANAPRGRRRTDIGDFPARERDASRICPPRVEDTEGERRAAFWPHGAGEGGSDHLARPAGQRHRADPWPAEPAVGRVADGVPGRVAQLRALGNAVVPACAEHIGRLVMEMAA